MRFSIEHESGRRLRVRACQKKMTLLEADVLEYYLAGIEGILKVSVDERTCCATIHHNTCKAVIIDALKKYDFESFKDILPEKTGRKLNRGYREKLIMSIVKRTCFRLFLPAQFRAVMTVYRAIKYICKGAQTLMDGKIEVPVLDATAIGVSLLRGDFDTAASVMFLLNVGETLEEWTHKKSVDDLARTMSLNVDKVWLVQDKQELLVPITEIKAGDNIVVRTGSMIPLDGKVVYGEAYVNQASMTGESMPVRKEEDSYVYAGTVVEEGACIIRVEKTTGSGRYDRIVEMIEESEKLKSASEDKASHLADHLVPYTLLGTGLVYLFTGNVTRALSVLMVDFSCALKLAMPISVLSAMREANGYDISVKGGKFMEAVAEADTIVFDKTGTLTHATPKVADVIAFGGNDRLEMLRLAACLEEHYPHSIANAVVEEARLRGLHHEERHSKVEYVVAHGISSVVDGQKAIIGSHHFVFQDEKATVPEGEEEKFSNLPDEYSHLYMAISGKLAAVICISDPVREEAGDVILELRRLGIKNVVMMTGDSEKTAASVASTIGVDEYFSEVLPEDKANYIRKEKELGRRVIMIGDGVNDSPALSEADAGIAISDGAAIAREIADITIACDDLYGLARLKAISNELMRRINNNYRGIIGFNGGLIALGVAGIIQPPTSALLHNMSTLLISTNSMRNLIKE